MFQECTNCILLSSVEDVFCQIIEKFLKKSLQAWPIMSKLKFLQTVLQTFLFMSLRKINIFISYKMFFLHILYSIWMKFSYYLIAQKIETRSEKMFVTNHFGTNQSSTNLQEIFSFQMFSRVHKIRTLFVPETHPQREKSWSSSWTIYVRLKLLHPMWKMALRKQFLTFRHCDAQELKY